MFRNVKSANQFFFLVFATMFFFQNLSNVKIAQNNFRKQFNRDVFNIVKNLVEVIVQIVMREILRFEKRIEFYD